MKTMLNIKMDADLKKKAQKVAKDLGLPLSVVINQYMKEFVSEKRIVFGGETPNARTRRVLDKALADIESGKNLSPAFDNAKDAIKWLRSNK